jgi:hypothetical protein
VGCHCEFLFPNGSSLSVKETTRLNARYRGGGALNEILCLFVPFFNFNHLIFCFTGVLVYAINLTVLPSAVEPTECLFVVKKRKENFHVLAEVALKQ